MKILDVLISENFDFEGDGSATGFTSPKISVSDLNSLQLRTLNRLRSGEVDIETANDKELEIIMDLIEIGLVDEDGNVTDSGNEAGDDDARYRVAADTDVESEFADEFDHEDKLRTTDTDAFPTPEDDDDDIVDFVVR